MNRQFIDFLASCHDSDKLGLLKVNWAGDTARSYVKSCEVTMSGDVCSVQLSTTMKGRDLLTVGGLVEAIRKAAGDTNPEYYFLSDKYTTNNVNGVICRDSIVILTM